MKRSDILMVVALFIVSSLVAIVAAADGYDLKYKMKKGESLTYAHTSKMEMIQEMMGSEQETEMNLTAKVKLTSEGEDDQGNLVQMLVYETFVADIFNAMIDSTLENPEGIVGKRIKKVMTSRGDQIESTRIDTFELGLLGQGGGFPGDREILPDLPEQPLKMGEGVTLSDVDSTASDRGKTIVSSELTYTVIGTENKAGYDCLKITAAGTVTIEGDGTMQGMNFFIEGDGDVKSTIFFAAEEGLLVAAESQNDIEMTIALTGQQNMTIPISQSTTSTLALEK